jgi:acetyl esterase/lipase
MSAFRVAAVFAGLGAATVAGTGTADGGRDWTGVQLAWRDDPRPPADAPDGVDVPSARRGTRRSQRRAATRRRQLPEEMPRATLPADGWRTMQSAPGGFADFGGFETVAPRPPFDAVPAAELGAMHVGEQPRGEAAQPFSTTSASGSGITTHRDQPYQPTGPAQPLHSRQRFDIHLPAGCSAGAMPLVIWIHGDTWRDGSKTDCPITWLAGEGYAVASIGYRTTDTAVFPAQLDDCRAAIAEIERNAELWGIDPARVAVAGSGAGGHLAALVGLAGQAPATASDPPLPAPRIAAVFAAAPPTSLTTLGPEHDRPTSAASRLVGGPLPEFREAAQRASPVCYVSPDDPPVLLLHGAADPSIPPTQSTLLDSALRSVGVDSGVVLLAGVGHKPSLAKGSAGGVALLSFLDRVLGPGIRPDDAPRP